MDKDPSTSAHSSLPLSKALRERTKDVHETSDRLVQAKMAFAFADRTLWVRLLQQFGHVYACIEECLAARRDDPHIQPLQPFFEKLRRSKAFLADVGYFSCKDATEPTLGDPCVATQAYLERIREVSASDPVLLIAYAQTMYLALLSGGQIIRKIQKNAMGLPNDKGGEIFEFEQIPTKKQAAFKKDLAAALDSLELNPTTIERIIAEKRSIFPKNDKITVEIVKQVPWSVVGKGLVERAAPYAIGVLVVVAAVYWVANLDGSVTLDFGGGKGDDLFAKE